MRTTMQFDKDTAAEPFVQETFELGLKIDVSNVADALDLLEGPQPR